MTQTSCKVDQGRRAVLWRTGWAGRHSPRTPEAARGQSPRGPYRGAGPPEALVPANCKAINTDNFCAGEAQVTGEETETSPRAALLLLGPSTEARFQVLQERNTWGLCLGLW